MGVTGSMDTAAAAAGAAALSNMACSYADLSACAQVRPPPDPVSFWPSIKFHPFQKVKIILIKFTNFLKGRRI